MMSMNVKFLLHMLQIMDFHQSLREISLQMLYVIYNTKRVLIFCYNTTSGILLLVLFCK